MEIERQVAAAPRTRALAQKLSRTNGPCVGCPGCAGLCDALFDLFLLPEIVLKRDRT